MHSTLAILPVALFILAGCGGGDDQVAPAPAPGGGATEEAEAVGGQDTVLIQGFRFQPASITVATGTRVTWTNEDQINHTVSAGTPEEPQATFDLELASAGVSVTHTFDEPGTYPYFCRVHESMQGEVTVE